MSTFLKDKFSTKSIRSIDDLRGYFEAFSKPSSEQKIGIECEVFGVNPKTGEALPYSGEIGIEAVLKGLAYEFGYEPVLEGDHVIALHKAGTMISLEPGGQVELSAEPVSSVHNAKAQLDEFFFELRTIGKFLGNMTFITAGIHPFTTLSKIEWVPKRRYAIMSKYLGQKDKRAHDMMKRTCANQINVDYENEEDAIEKMRLALRITPVAAAMFAHSGFAGGKPTGFVAERLNIWRFTDPARCGLVLKLACDQCRFEDYLNYVLEVPVLFIVRDNEWIVPQNLTFRKWIEKDYQGIKPTQSDFELHLSTIFTDARFKQYLELRAIDCQRVHLIPAVYAFWKGLLYSAESRKAAKNVVRYLKDEELSKLHCDVETLGLRAKIRKVSVLEMAKQLVKISEDGLAKQNLRNEEGGDERIYLAPLQEEILKRGKTPAEQLNDLWKGPMRQDRRALIKHLEI